MHEGSRDVLVGWGSQEEEYSRSFSIPMQCKHFFNIKGLSCKILCTFLMYIKQVGDVLTRLDKTGLKTEGTTGNLIASCNFVVILLGST